MAAINKRIRTKHGAADSPTYDSWHCMKSRCTKPEDISFKYYGGRGIRVTPEWIDPQNGYLNFLRDVGERPSRDYTLDRNTIAPFSMPSQRLVGIRPD